MVKWVVRVVVAVGLVGSGWFAARAQSGEPDFVISIAAPGGSTSITCVKGCRLAWVERGVNPNSRPMRSFDFSCTASQCGSGQVGGWLTDKQ